MSHGSQEFADASGSSELDSEWLERFVGSHVPLGRFNSLTELEYGFSVLGTMRATYGEHAAPGHLSVFTNMLSRDPDTLSIGVHPGYIGIWVSREIYERAHG